MGTELARHSVPFAPSQPGAARELEVVAREKKVNLVLAYGCLGSLLLFGELPLLFNFGRELWQRPQYQFFPIMLVGAAAVGFDRWQDYLQGKSHLPAGTGGDLRKPSPWITVPLLILSLAALLIGGVFWIRNCAGISTLLLIMTVIWHCGGGRLLRVMWPSLLLLLVIIPPPGHWDESFTLTLQQFAVTMSSRLLDILHVPHVQLGNTLEIPGRSLLVDQACSGINSLMAIVGFALIYGFWKRRSPIRLAAILGCAVFLVIWANLLRITAEAWLKVRCGIDLLDGTAHELLGLLLFLTCAGLVASADVLFEDLWQAWRDRRRINEYTGPMIATPAQPQTPGIKRAISIANPGAPGWQAWAIGVTFALAGVFVAWEVRNAWPASTLSENAKFDLPEGIDGWQRLNDSPALIERPQTIARIERVALPQRQCGGERRTGLSVHGIP